MVKALTLAEHTLFAELMERSLDAQFDDDFPENGSFVMKRATNSEGVRREYFYYVGYRKGQGGEAKDKRYSRYVGPADDAQIVARVARFKEIKSARKEAISIVNALVGVGITRPPVITGRIIEALAKAGLFRLRAVMIGTAAYQAYPALLGFRLSQRAAITGDVDVARLRSVALATVGETPALLKVLWTVDPSFRSVPPVDDLIASTSFVSATGFRLSVITTQRGNHHQTGTTVRMPAPKGAAAEQLNFMDYLIRNPQRSVVLRGAGVAVTVPAPERFAVHKLIISTRRLNDLQGQAKARWDVLQAGEIIMALHEGGRIDTFKVALAEALERGAAWRTGISGGAASLPPDVRAVGGDDLV